MVLGCSTERTQNGKPRASPRGSALFSPQRSDAASASPAVSSPVCAEGDGERWETLAPGPVTHPSLRVRLLQILICTRVDPNSQWLLRLQGWCDVSFEGNTVLVFRLFIYSYICYIVVWICVTWAPCSA